MCSGRAQTKAEANLEGDSLTSLTQSSGLQRVWRQAGGRQANRRQSRGRQEAGRQEAGGPSGADERYFLLEGVNPVKQTELSPPATGQTYNMELGKHVACYRGGCQLQTAQGSGLLV